MDDNHLGTVLTAPFDVLLGAVATPIEPDFLFLRTGREPQPGATRYRGVPDLIVEVLSPGNRHHDRLVKFKVYEEVGVPEFWLVDPMERSVTIYVLDDEGRFTELDRGGDGDTVRSREIGGFSLQVADLFPPRQK